MPELPEVETITRELNRRIRGRRIEKVHVFRADALGNRSPEAFADDLYRREIHRVSRRGKFLIFHLRPRRYLVCHLRMTGKFIVTAPLRGPHPHHRLWFALDDGSLLVFQDVRCFGTLEVVDRLSASASLERLGIEPLSKDFCPEWLTEALGRSRTPLKNWLMDQRRIAGLGNIYASEILFAAGISPTRPADSIDGDGALRLHGMTKRILKMAIRKNGTTISDFRRVDEKTGEFQNFLQVYGKTGEPCPRCKTPIVRIRQQQRSTFYCPRCQL